MTITTTKLTRAAGLAAVAGGLLFIAVQLKHPHLDAAFTTTTEWAVRETMKICMAVLSLIGITGIYLRQVKQTGVLGLVGYVVLGLGYLAILSNQVVAVFVLPTLAASSARLRQRRCRRGRRPRSGRRHRRDTAFHPVGRIRLHRRWRHLRHSSVPRRDPRPVGRSAPRRWRRCHRRNRLAAAAGNSSKGCSPFPVSIALIGLGYSLWREQRTQAARPAASTDSPQLDPAGAK